MTSEHPKIAFAHLDALRGIASLSVGWLHAWQLLGVRHGFETYPVTLRPDFFFCLSAFYIGSIYQKRFELGMSPSTFLRRRLVRLYPMLLAGVLFGTALLLLHGLAGGGLTPVRSFIIGLGALVLFPVGLFYGYQAFPCNNPMWSLVFEAIFYVSYSRTARLIGRNLLFLLVPSAIMVVIVSYVFQGLSQTGYSSWSGFAAGFGRAAFPFLVGLGIARYWSVLVIPKIPATANLLLFLVFFAFDWSGGWLAECIIALLVVPVTVLLGSKTELPLLLHPIAKWGGTISYPFYMLHQPTLRLCKAFETKLGILEISSHANVVGGLLIALIVAVVAYRWLDAPLRAMAARRLREPDRKVLMPTSIGAASDLVKTATDGIGSLNQRCREAS